MFLRHFVAVIGLAERFQSAVCLRNNLISTLKKLISEKRYAGISIFRFDECTMS